MWIRHIFPLQAVVSNNNIFEISSDRPSISATDSCTAISNKSSWRYGRVKKLTIPREWLGGGGVGRMPYNVQCFPDTLLCVSGAGGPQRRVHFSTKHHAYFYGCMLSTVSVDLLISATPATWTLCFSLCWAWSHSRRIFSTTSWSGQSILTPSTGASCWYPKTCPQISILKAGWAEGFCDHVKACCCTLFPTSPQPPNWKFFPCICTLYVWRSHTEPPIKFCQYYACMLMVMLSVLKACRVDLPYCLVCDHLLLCVLEGEVR